MTIRSQLDGKEFPTMPPFIDALSAGVNEEIQAAIQPFLDRIDQLEQQVTELGGQVAEIGSRQTSGGSGDGSSGGSGDGTTGGATGSSGGGQSPPPQLVSVSAALLLAPNVRGGNIRIAGDGKESNGAQTTTLEVPVGTEVTVSVRGLISIDRTITNWNGPDGIKTIRVGEVNEYVFTATDNSIVSANVTTLL